jgi:D-3-phosphoglycerate dehydrogenase / 2-oxoglutarate reductase
VTGRIVVSTRSFGSGAEDTVALLTAAGYKVDRIERDHDLDTCAPALADAVGWIAGTGPIGPAHLAAAPHLRVIARYGVGVDAVDLDAAAARGVVVTNTPGANAAAVADHTVGLALAALRHLVTGDRAVRRGDWSRRLGRELGACVVGVVGFGAVGREVARRFAGFGSHVVAYDPFLTPSRTEIPLVPLEELLATADVVTLHAPGGGPPLIDATAIAGMRPGAVLVNTARASLIDETAVASALASGHLGACASDVVADEHGVPSPLLEARHTTLTPHVAGHTREAIDRMGRTAAQECLRVLRGEPPHHPVRARPRPEGSDSG